MREFIYSALESVDIIPSGEQVYKLEKYAQLLIEANKVMNLTGITSPEKIAYLHFADSAAPLKLITQGSSVIDIGSGAGFPGLPMKILRPDLEMTLYDSLQKRVSFLEEVCSAIDIGAHCVNGRAEEDGHNPLYRERFDYGISRAVARLDMLCELCLPFIKPGGYLLAMKSSHADSELPGADSVCEKLGAVRDGLFSYTILDIPYCVYKIKKISPTPEIYPRRFAKIKKSYLSDCKTNIK